MSSSAGLLALLSLLARAAWTIAQTENPFLTTTLGTPPPPSGTSAGQPGVPPVGTPPPPTGTPFPPGDCGYPTNSSQVGLVLFDDEATAYDGWYEGIGSCECDVGKKSFWASGPTSDTDLAANAITTVGADGGCPDLCLIDEAGTECKLSGPDPSGGVYLMPFCASGKCHMYALFDSDMDLVCGSKSFTYNNQLMPEGSPKTYQPLDPDANPQVYVHAAAFTCKGCAAIRNSNCLKPISGPDCGRIESLVQVDAANSSILTTGLNAAWSGWSRSDKANFALYKKRIENTVYEPIWSGAEKVSAVSKIVDSYAPDGSSAKDLILAIPIAGFGTFCDFLNCAVRRGLLQATEKDCLKFTPTTTVPLTTTTASSQASCEPLEAEQIGLTLGEGAASDGSGSIKVHAECPCTSGVRIFMQSLTGPSPTNDAIKSRTYYGVTCEDAHSLCICREDGVCCTPVETPPTSIGFIPSCAYGECHVYAVQDGDRSSSKLMCTDGRLYAMEDQFVDSSNLLYDLEPYSPYIEAQSVSCGGCAPIQPANEVCTGPAKPLDT